MLPKVKVEPEQVTVQTGLEKTAEQPSAVTALSVLEVE
jgi:hypothetical protein